jgi:hypothetical protein
MTRIRDVIIKAHNSDGDDVFFTVAVITDDSNGTRRPRRWSVRISGDKSELDALLDTGVLSEIDLQIRAGRFEEIDRRLPA